MAEFSYTTGDDAEDRDYLRFRINDTVEGAGPKPDDGNFLDAELDMTITSEGSWQHAIVACYEALEVAWAPHVSWTADGMSISQSNTSLEFRKMAERWRKILGMGPGVAAHSRTMIRIDGYSQDIQSDEVT